MRTAQGLETVHHDAPSTIGTDTIIRSGGAIPDVFLCGAGLSEPFISEVRLLVNTSHYTCFISHSSQDDYFAEQLNADLENEGVPCWLDREDMDISDNFPRRIEESIRRCDKLLLVLSKDSIASKWVAYEVELALKKEAKGIPNVLCPICIDNTINNCSTNWAQKIRDALHIGDFTKWKDPDQYDRSFQHLLRALTRAEKPA